MTELPDHGRRAAEHAPVFLLAPARSFSTVSLAVLAGHPDLFGFPEMLLFGVPDVHGLLTEQARRPGFPSSWTRYRVTGILRAIAELHEGSQQPEAIMRAQNWLAERPRWPTVRLMDHLLDLARPRTGLEKSPDSTRSDEALDACIAAYPRARFIHLTRHPVTTQESMHRYYKPRWKGDTRAMFVQSATTWYLSHLRVAKRLAKMPEGTWIRVRAEDMLRDPGTCLPRICDWLGLPCDPDVVARMQRTENWRFASAGPCGDLGGGDPKFLRGPALRPVPAPEPVCFDPAWGLHPDLTSRMTRFAAFLGY